MKAALEKGEGRDKLIALLLGELKAQNTAIDVARLRAEYDLPFIQAEVSRFELVVSKLTSEDPADIYSRYKGFLYSSSIDTLDGPF